MPSGVQRGCHTRQSQGGGSIWRAMLHRVRVRWRTVELSHNGAQVASACFGGAAGLGAHDGIVLWLTHKCCCGIPGSRHGTHVYTGSVERPWCSFIEEHSSQGQYVCGVLSSLRGHACVMRAGQCYVRSNPPSLPLLTSVAKRAGPCFLLGEGEGSQGRRFSVPC